MLLELTREGDYAVRAMLALAGHRSEEPLSRRRIADDWDVPTGFLAHVMRRLAVAGLVVPVLGRSGGYRLGRDPDEITLLDVVRAVEELPEGRRCVLRGGPCRPDGTCLAHPAFSAAQDRYLAELESRSLRDVLDVAEVPDGA